jgi:pyruvate dehydrogenase E2 component (dihydrolipoamide acetyltransferase)
VTIENILVPDLGDASDVEVIELLVAVGDTVAEEDSLLVLESDKAAMEIPAPKAGVIKTVEVNLGDKVSSGSLIVTLEVEGAAEDSAAPASSGESKSEEAEASGEAAKPAEQDPASSDGGEQLAAEPAQASLVDVLVPDLGTEDEVEIIEIAIAVGDTLAVDDTLMTLESDKAAMDVPSDRAGVVKEILVAVGDKVKNGDAIVRVLAEQKAEQKAQSNAQQEPTQKADQRTASETQKTAPAADQGSGNAGAASPAPASPSTSSVTGSPSSSSGSSPNSPVPGSESAKVYAGPAVRKLARELGVDLTQVSGSGAKSRITKDDVHGFVKARLNAPAAVQGGAAIAAVPDIDFSQFGEIEEIPRSKLHKLTASNMQRNWNAVPHVAQFNEIDITDLEDFRASLKGEAERKGVKMTFLPFLLKACAKALAEYPQFNVSLHSSGEYLIQKKYIHIGVAVATDAGLVVPVIRDVDKKDLWELAAEVVELSNKAKARKLAPQDMQGACFSISSLGALGGTGFIPIVNAPEVAILGVAKTAVKPQFIDKEFVPRQMLPITLSYDHKAVNGVDGGLFVTYLDKLLSDIRNLVL